MTTRAGASVLEKFCNTEKALTCDEWEGPVIIVPLAVQVNVNVAVVVAFGAREQFPVAQRNVFVAKGLRHDHAIIAQFLEQMATVTVTLSAHNLIFRTKTARARYLFCVSKRECSKH